MKTKEVVAVSGGKDSTAMALRLREVEPDADRVYLITPTGDELPGMRDHWTRLEQMLGAKLVTPPGPTLAELIDKQHALPSHRARWCTRLIKIVPCEIYLKSLCRPCSCGGSTHCKLCDDMGNVLPTLSVGLRADEPTRIGLYGPYATYRYPLREWSWGIRDVLTYLERRGIEVPKRTDCARCPLQRLHEWYDLWNEHPGIYEDAIRQEAEVSKFRGKRYSFRNPNRDTWAGPLVELREEFKTRGPPKQRKVSADGPCRVCRL